MRVRMLVAGVTLAAFVTVLGAPVALAAPPDPPPPPVQSDDNEAPKKDEGASEQKLADPKLADPKPPKASLSVSPDGVEPGKEFVASASCTENADGVLSAPGVSFSGGTGTVGKGVAPGTTITVTLTCTNGAGAATAVDTLKVIAPAAQQQPPVQQQPAQPPPQQPPPPQQQPPPPPPVQQPPLAPASLTVSPDQRRPGERFAINATCPTAGTVRLSADPAVVDFDDDLDGGTVDGDALEGDVVIKLICPDDSTATDTLKVFDDRDAYLDLDPNSGFREDKVDVEAYCPGTAEARLNSPVLDDITLKRDGDDVLRGTTRVEREAAFGGSFGEVLCKGGERPRDGFRVLQHRKADLDLDPAFGKRGDEIKVYVVCDFTVGRLESDVLDDVEVSRDEPSWRHRGKTRVVSDAEGGEHTVRIRCGDDTLEEEFFVIVDGERPRGGTQVTVYPKGAPQTGGGPVGIGPAGTLDLAGPAGTLGLAGPAGFATLPGRRTVRR